MNHVLSCRGEAIKVILSDNASVGKNWLTTVALPQYLVDQGLAEVVLVIFLENNHGKYLADMLFGQFQSRRRREVLLGIDDMLSGFERINRRNGNVRGFAVNPLSSIDFAAVFHSLGYETKPPADFGFVRRNIHVAGACVAGAKNRLPIELRELFEPALPDDVGMVRISTEPPGDTSQMQLPFEDRYIDVPAARLQREGEHGNFIRGIAVRRGSDDDDEVQLVVPLDLLYSTSGKGVVSTRTAEHVGYNGIEFRKLNACPEMRDTSRPLVRQAWPRGLLEVGRAPASDEPVAQSENVKCAPLNWIVRKPVRHFCDSESDWKARYPPRNLLNAKFRKGPREEAPWVPTATYSEPPFPVLENTAAFSAMKILAAENGDISKSLHFLHALKVIYKEMGDRQGVSDPWLQKRATNLSRRALERYRYDLSTYVQREKGRPKAPKTLRQIFREDEKVLEEVSRVLAGHNLHRQAEKSLRSQTLMRLFNDAEKTPGAFDRFQYLLEQDQERYFRELKDIKKKQEEFDKEHGLHPVE